jgi:hypothetical protein
MRVRGAQLAGDGERPGYAVITSVLNLFSRAGGESTNGFPDSETPE